MQIKTSNKRAKDVSGRCRGGFENEKQWRRVFVCVCALSKITSLSSPQGCSVSVEKTRKRIGKDEKNEW